MISTVLAGQDCLCVMPTGGGKSLCYQLPALVLDGLTLVVSPLIALMKDQVDQLQALGLPVSLINSTLSTAEQNQRLDRMAAGEYRLLYVVPERFRSGRFLDAVRAVGVKLLAVDEAHCISEWGHDFRPDYARLGLFSPPAGQSDDDRPDGHGHRPRAPRHRRAARLAPARDLHHRFRPAEPVLRGRDAARASGRSRRRWSSFSPHARLGHHLHLDPQTGRGGGRDDRR